MLPGWAPEPAEVDPIAVPLPLPYRPTMTFPSNHSSPGWYSRNYGGTSAEFEGHAFKLTQVYVFGVNLLDSFDMDVVLPPCTLVLQVFAADRTTLAWSVNTLQGSGFSYLDLPENYGEQEIDVVNGAATIGQAEVIVIDKPQIPGDQDSGWLTEQIQDVFGRRCRLLLYTEGGWVVIADGPAGAPRLDESYSAYRWLIKDTREGERTTEAFVSTSDNWLLPKGLEVPFGAYVDELGADQWLVPATAPLTGMYREELINGYLIGGVRLDEDTTYWAEAPFGPPVNWPEGEVDPAVVVTSDAEKEFIATFEILGDPRPVLWTWPRLEILWRLAGTTDPWTVVNPTDLLPEGRNVAKPVGAGRYWRTLCPVYDATLADGTEVRATIYIMLRGYQATGSFPPPDTEVDVAVRYKGPPTSYAPFHLEGLTEGQLLQNLYDGLYSPRDASTGLPIPTGIRYDPAQLALMTRPVLARITEPVEDLRVWAEEHAYAPRGWCPALDNDGRISPVSQIPPEDFVANAALINNAVTEPTSDWDAGERVINIVRFTYERLYVPAGIVETLDGIMTREVVLEYRNETSIDRHGEQRVELSGACSAALGDSLGNALDTEFSETLAEERRVHIFDRYAAGAPAISVPVMRSAAPALRAGSWVVVDASWFPDFLTRRRGLLMGGQVIALRNIDCLWMGLLIEEVIPLERGS